MTQRADMTVEDAEADPHSQPFDELLPAIARQEAPMAGERASSRLAVHSANLVGTLTNLGQAIAEERERPDAVDLIAPGRLRAEEFHSRIISWLLDPSAHHQQAEHFIAALLNSTMAPPQLLDADWSDAQVHPEWGIAVDGQQSYLDILVLNLEYQCLIAIENKTLFKQHSNQLTRYRRAQAGEYPDYARHHIFLSPSGVPPYLERDREY